MNQPTDLIVCAWRFSGASVIWAGATSCMRTTFSSLEVGHGIEPSTGEARAMRTNASERSYADAAQCDK
jgi:hypothetical protein